MQTQTRLIGRVCVMAVVIALLGCDQSGPTGGSPPETPETPESPEDQAAINREVDASIDESIKERSEKAVAWLKRSDTYVWEGSKAETLAMAQKMIGLGAAEVLVIDIVSAEELAGKGEIASRFVIVLPPQSKQTERKTVIEAYNQWALGDYELTPEEREEFLIRDTGQKYILLEYD